KRLTREMDVWWKLDHPNIVPLWGYINDLGELPSMVAQWYENGNACGYIEKEVLPVEFRLQLLREVTLGLQYLHVQSPAIIHGDLKPANILIDNEGVARLSDFGLAHLATSGEVTLGSAGNGATIRYAAPEIRSPADDEASTRATKESDIYSLACIAYEFVYRKLPFAEKPTIQTIIAAGYNHIPPARRDSEDSSVMGPQTLYYWDLLESCWDETPSRRPDITAFCDHIDVIFQDMGTA
ncbi:kinase-like protein, partial [Serendipita vermifera]